MSIGSLHKNSLFYIEFLLDDFFFTFLYELQGDKMKRTVKFILVAAVIAILYACATAGWHKDGVSEFETENALAQCEYEKGKVISEDNNPQNKVE